MQHFLCSSVSLDSFYYFQLKDHVLSESVLSFILEISHTSIYFILYLPKISSYNLQLEQCLICYNRHNLWLTLLCFNISSGLSIDLHCGVKVGFKSSATKIFLFEYSKIFIYPYKKSTPSSYTWARIHVATIHTLSATIL